jgi:phosphatidylinositol alpha-1,6-mannosyltransferase
MGVRATGSPVRARLMRHLLVTNDFPPKMGGIQSYLWELWRRLPPAETTVLTTAFDGAAAFDAAQPFRIERIPGRVMAPTHDLARRVDRLAAEVDAGLVLLDPAVPLGHIGPRLERRFGVVLHGAEVTIPGRIPGARHELARVLQHARLVVAAGGYPADEATRAAGRALPTTVIPPGVDVERFRPLDQDTRSRTRLRLGVGSDAALIVAVSRLVPRKGMDTLIKASVELARTHRNVRVVIAGAGRDRARLQRLIDRTGAPAGLAGRVPEALLPAVYGCADVFAMLCRNRWAGLEQEGFGIVFLEAAACGVPQVAGRSGGSHEAVEHGVTGLIVDDPHSVSEAVGALTWILDDAEMRASMAVASRARAVEHFTYDRLAIALQKAIDGVGEPR